MPSVTPPPAPPVEVAKEPSAVVQSEIPDADYRERELSASASPQDSGSLKFPEGDLGQPGQEPTAATPVTPAADSPALSTPALDSAAPQQEPALATPTLPGVDPTETVTTDPSGPSSLGGAPSESAAGAPSIGSPAPVTPDAVTYQGGVPALIPAQPQPQPTIAPAVPQSVLAEPAQPTLASPTAAAPTAVIANPIDVAIAQEIQLAARQAKQRLQSGFALADRGAAYSARAEFIAALRIVAEAQDRVHGRAEQGRALTRGLRALTESQEFAESMVRSTDVSIAHLAAGHRTPVLKDKSTDDITASAAEQAYLAYARYELAFAAGKEPVGSLALYGLGRVTGGAEHARLGASRCAITLYEAALEVDGGNFRAANEAGVQMARLGLYPDARTMLARAAALQPTAATWQNLAAVHAQLGEVALAEKARQRATAGQRPQAGPNVQWVDAQTFAGSGEMPRPISAQNVPAPKQASKAAASGGSARR